MKASMPRPALDPAVAEPDRVDILGVEVSAINLARGVAQIEGWIENGHRGYVCVTGVHGVMESQRDRELMRIHNDADLVTPDGMPLVWLSWYYGHREVDRVYGPDLVLALAQRAAEKGHSFYLYGGNDGVPELLSSKLRERFPGLVIAGSHSPPFRALTPEEEDEVVERINASGADIVLVGLSTPKQERWMARFRPRLEAAALLGVGAAFDFHAGLKKQAPRWMQRGGLEWLYRMLSEPRRLGLRYLVNNPLFISQILAQLAGRRDRGSLS